MQGKKRDWVGVVQGELTVVEDIGKNKHGSRLWKCVCSCGATVTKSNLELKQGVKSCSAACGVSASNKARAKHGLYKSKVYTAWASMNVRCSNPSAPNWSRYGGRSIKVCDAWVNDFQAFYDYVGEPPTAKHTLDRIDNDKGYEPGNVRWATRKEQSNNRSTNTWVEYDGKRMTWAQWADYLGISYATIMSRRSKHSELQDILVVGKKPVGRPRKESN